MSEAMTIVVQATARDGRVFDVHIYEPPGDPLGLIQILHGLGEHAGRYARFAASAAGRGYVVAIHNHRGHGPGADAPPFFASRGGWLAVTEDALAVAELLERRYPGKPLTLLGHSMGSFIAQQFAMLHGARLSALLLSGSNWASRIEIGVAHLLARIECLRLGERKSSALLDKLLFAGFNRPFRPARTELDWLSRDVAEVDKYVDDPLCGAPYSAGLWRDLTGGLLGITSDNAVGRVPSDLPILISGGATDPVGGDKGMGRLALHYAQTGHTRMKVKIYDDARHEMLNETNRDEVTDDWLDWIDGAL